MIYLVLTSSIDVENNINYVGKGTDKRKTEYITSINNTLNIMKNYPQIKIILVENNGERNTYLDEFKKNGLDIVYTNTNFITPLHNQNTHSVGGNDCESWPTLRILDAQRCNIPNIEINKGHKELFDIKEVIKRYNMDDNDYLIKLTGRYYMNNSTFIDTIIKNINEYDAFIKFFNVCTRQFEHFDCVLGMVCMTVNHWKNIEYTENISAEVNLAKYVRKYCIVKEIIDLGLTCNHFDSYNKSNF